MSLLRIRAFSRLLCRASRFELRPVRRFTTEKVVDAKAEVFTTSSTSTDPSPSSTTSTSAPNFSTTSFSSTSSASATSSSTAGAEQITEEQLQELLKQARMNSAGSPETEAKKETKDIPKSTEQRSGDTQKYEFKAETRQLLNIVTNSIYTDKEVFLRELISNASDAMEKCKALQATTEILEPQKPLEIHIVLDNVKKTLTIQDSGIGMSPQELVDNLGTIARSGSKAFREMAAKKGGGAEAASAANIIGQFGVGFYSTFMVARKVEVFSRSADPKSPAAAGNYWVSDGSGNYEMSEAKDVPRGTKVILHLKDDKDSKAFAQKHIIEGIVRKYSNFVQFPIYLNGIKCNTFSAIWANKNASDADHTEFYRYLANAYDSPSYRLHFTTDAPISINALFYFPSRHMEKYGMGRQEPGVSVYSRKVLIQAKSKLILPDWLRFVKGVVDSEDIPLNLSRETMQDSALIAKMKTVLTKKVIRFLDEQSRKDAAKYEDFFREFGIFLKEGVVHDVSHKDDVAKLLRFDTSLGKKQLQSLDDYIARMPPGQDAIYYLNTSSREIGQMSPYYEAFAKKKLEVLFLYHHVDDFVMKALDRYNNRKIVSIESNDAEMMKAAQAEDDQKSTDPKQQLQQKKTEEDLLALFKSVLKDRLSAVTISKRVMSAPALVIDHDSAAVRRLIKYLDPSQEPVMPKQKLEINSKHPLLVKLAQIKDFNKDLSSLIVEQIFDNALIAADILDNPRQMLNRLSKILDHAASSTLPASSSSTASSTSSSSSSSTPKPTPTHTSTSTSTASKKA
eukprot:TRINITY_DN2860_c0_g1_i1.p1 TRINITY_DN2860_c0_g1~~TRINITY_DN2860_c0_g1_i1.p1  ORF type:complete len:792 (+),score=269.03 TRINITY_DN2860_c0_g1_i1:2-2377(+)